MIEITALGAAVVAGYWAGRTFDSPAKAVAFVIAKVKGFFTVGGPKL